MADVEKSAVFKVEVDFGDLEKNQQAIKQKIAEITNAQLQLDVSTKENQKTFKENASTLKTLDAQMKLNEKTLNGLTEAEKKNTDQTNFNNNSIKQNRELLKQLNAEYINLQNPTKEQTARVKELTDTLKKQESAIGDNRRSVGGYAEAFQSVLQSIPGLTNGLGGVANGFKAISMANPFTALFLILPPIITYLSKFEDVFDGIEKVIGGVSGALTGVVANFSKLLSLDFSGFIDGVTESASAGYELVKATQDLEDAQRALNVETAKTESQVKNLIIQSKDRTKTEQERLALLDQASALEKRNFQQTLNIAKEELRIADEELKRAEKAGTANDALRDKRANAEIKLIQLQSSSADLQEKITNRKNALIESETTARQQASDKRKAQIEKEKAETEKRLAEAKKLAEDLKKAFEDTTNAEFQFTKEMTEVFFGEQDARLRQQLADRKITLEEFNKQVEENKKLQLETELQYLVDYQTTVGGLEDDIAKKKIELSNLATATAIDNINKEDAKKKESAKKDAELQKQKILQLAQFTEATTATFVSTLTAQGDFLKNFQKALGITLLDIIEKQAIGSATIQSFASPESIATGGIAGAIKAGIIVGLIKSAFSIARGALQGFADGGLVEDLDGFAGGGLSGKRITSSDGRSIRRSNGDNLLATVKTGEVILNQRQQNALGGAHTFRKIGVPGFADGGIISDAGVQAIRDGVNNTEAGLQPLVDAIKELQIQVSVSEITDVQNNLRKQVQIAEL